GSTARLSSPKSELAEVPALLSEVANLVEQPTPFLGHFDEEYLHIPADVLVAVMKKHQRCFPVVRDSGFVDSELVNSKFGESEIGERSPESRITNLRIYESTNLLPYFIAVRNGGDEHLDIVRHNNEEVIRARFADADYFYRKDTKKPLEEFLPRLATLTFQEQLGSMLDKTHRLEQLVVQLAEMLGLSEEETAVSRRAAHLSKADLATQMVVEFTSLQGVMGREYALKSGEDPAVAEAISEHYLPRFAGDVPSRTKPGLVVGLANRLDSLAGLFAVGLAPTGSSDPYHLRRDAIGLVQNLIVHQLPFSMRDGLVAAARLLPVDVSSPPPLEEGPGEEYVAAALDFVVERLRGVLRKQGFRYDVVDGVLAARGDDPFR
ncbi:MAG: glycine--tRNA ligase subunit beta, partial [Anaerolineae bacterium]|nr:glycine--tRNA ligase subunit beta [Anaerolineae bacterium]